MEVWLVIPIAIVIIGAIYFVVKDGTDYAEQLRKQSEANHTHEAAEPQLEAGAAANDPADSWVITGWLFTILGAGGLCAGLFMDTSVETYRSTELAPYLPSSIVNLDLLFQKGLAIVGSMFAIGAGIFCLGISAVVKAIGRKA